MTMDIEARITRRLLPILNLPLTIARDAGNMKNFQFGTIRDHPSGDGTIGDYALHIQCPWRIVADGRILTGSADYYEPVVEGEEVNLDDRRSGNLQRKLLGSLFPTCDARTRSQINETTAVIVTAVHADRFGGLDVELSGGFRLQIFPSGSRGEDWRFFSPRGDDRHFVVEGGRPS